MIISVYFVFGDHQKHCLLLQLLWKSFTAIKIEFRAVNVPNISYYIMVGEISLTEDERVQAGIASPPKGCNRQSDNVSYPACDYTVQVKDYLSFVLNPKLLFFMLVDGWL